MAMWELRQRVLQEYQALRTTQPVNERSFMSSFSRYLRNMERKGLLHLSLRPTVSQWPRVEASGDVYQVELREEIR